MKKRKSEQRRFNILDFFLIFLIVLSVAAILLRQYSPQKDRREAIELEVTLRVERLHEETLACLLEGDLLYSASGEYFGSVIRLDASPSKISLLGEGVLYEDAPPEEEWVDLTLLASVWGSRSGDLFLQDGKLPLLLGKEITLYSNLTSLRAKITEVRESPQ